MVLVIRPELSAPKKMAIIANHPRTMLPIQGVVVEAAPMVKVISSDDVEVVGVVALAGEAMTPRDPDEREGEEVVDEVPTNLRTIASVGHANRIRKMESGLKRLFAG